jgi:hypothetical protein
MRTWTQMGRSMRPIERKSFLSAAVWVGGGLMLLVGCNGPGRTSQPLPALPRVVAERIVNANASLIDGTLRAMGSVDGTVTDEKGVRRSFSLDGVLFYLRPSYLRFDLKKFGDRQILLGSNAEQYWIYNKQDGAFRCSVHGDDEELSAAFPIRPRQLLDALGLSPIGDSFRELLDALGLSLIGDSLRDQSVGRVQRIETDSQQILFIVRDESGAMVVEKEYWLDRFAPRLIRRVVFRDGDGGLEMDSRLSDYRVSFDDGPLLPHLMEANWPGAGASLTFTIAKWSVHPAVGPTGPQFSTPEACTSNGT